MVTLTEPAKIQCYAAVLELELQWDWMPEDIYSNKMNCWSPLLPLSEFLFVVYCCYRRKKRERKVSFLSGSNYLHYLLG